VFILIVIFSALKGVSTGFFAGVARIIGLILGIAVALIGYRPLAAYLDSQWAWGDTIAEFLVGRFSQSLLSGLVNKIPINELQQTIPGNLDNIAHQLAITALEFISFVVLLMVVALAVKLMMRFFSGAVAHTFLSPLDHFGGLLLGLVRGVLIVLVMALLLEPVLAAGVIVGHEKTGFLGRAAAGSLIIPYAWQLLNIINLHFPLWPSSLDLLWINGCKYI
jgi:uncharacterized membrane protein required for colicin V production